MIGASPNACMPSCSWAVVKILRQIERFWKLFLRKVARNQCYATFAEFRIAVQKVLNNIVSYRDELASLMTERFQLFTTP